MTKALYESDLEAAALEWFADLGYSVRYGPDMASGEPGAERYSYDTVWLSGRLNDALARLNPRIPYAALSEALDKVTRLDSPILLSNNKAFHKMLVEGVEVEHLGADGRSIGEHVRLVDFDDPENNDWLVVNQFTVVEGRTNRRPDIVVFLNGLPLTVIELKNPADEEATIWAAFSQLQNYKDQIPSIFAYNEALIPSDGLEARIGSLTASEEWFHVWRTADGETLADRSLPPLQVMIYGLFEKDRFLDFLRHFIVFEDDGKQVHKKLAGYHQIHAVNKAVESTIQASKVTGDRRAGVVWHTQGSGKSLTMVFYAGKIILSPEMRNPTIVVITDRNDLDDQLFGTFSRCAGILRQTPVQAQKREDLYKLLQVASGGVVFTTMQKFFPENEEDEDGNPKINGKKKKRHEGFSLLSDRRNIVVIADEAHRSQYGIHAKLNKDTGGMEYGYAKYLRDALPNASFIAFTGTPIELADRNTKTVFGDYISIYDIQQAVEDHATVRIFYEARMAKLNLDAKERPHIDPDFEEVTEGEEEYRKEKLKTKWGQLEAVVGTEKRLKLVAKDLVEHFENRLEAMDGKAMVVCMSRRICVDLYKYITEIRPDWHDPDDDKGAIKVLMTGSAADDKEWQPHIRNKKGRDNLATRFKDPNDPFKVAIVRDMWLTGFDVPCLHTMYLDKPMHGHTLMQAIARVNRIFRDKDGGLVVDYIGLATHLREALAGYTAGGGRGKAVLDLAEAVAWMIEKFEICQDIFHGFDYSGFLTGSPTERLSIFQNAKEYILSLDREKGDTPDDTPEDKPGKRKVFPERKRFFDAVAALSAAFALASSTEEAIRIREEVAFFQAVKAALIKLSARTPKAELKLDHAIRQIVSKAIASDQVVDIFSAAGLKKPDISILSDEFLAEVQGMKHRNLAIELLHKLINDEIVSRERTNVVQNRSFAKMLDKTVRAYQNRSVEAAKVITELIDLAKNIRESSKRGERLNLTEEEIAFYDALEVNDSAVKVLGDAVLRAIAQELVVTVRKSVTIDWTVKESVKANIRRLVKRILKKHGYPPDKQEKAVKTVLDQAEALCADWV